MSRKSLRLPRICCVDRQVQIRARPNRRALNQLQSQGENDPERIFNDFTVWRRACSAFSFSDDYAAFFDGLMPEDQDVIYRGPLSPENEQVEHVLFADDHVQVGQVYAYWISAGDFPAVGPLPVKVRDPEIWWSYQRVSQEIDALIAADPGQVTRSVIGHTVRGMDIHAARVGTGPVKLAMVGLIHGGESGPEMMLPAMSHLLKEHGDLLDQASVLAIPAVNWDARQDLVQGVPWYLRTNAAGVDLNRNFPASWDRIDVRYGMTSDDPNALTFRGYRAASEPETQAVMAALREHRPTMVYSMHCLSSICGQQMLGPGEAGDDQAYQLRVRAIADAYLAPIKADPLPDWDDGALDKPSVQFGPGGTSAGSLPLWCYRELGAAAVDAEGPWAVAMRDRARDDATDLATLNRYRRMMQMGLPGMIKALG